MLFQNFKMCVLIARYFFISSFLLVISSANMREKLWFYFFFVSLQNMDYTAIIKKMENGYYFAQCEQLPAALTQGRTIDEAKENLKDAINLLLEDEKADFQKQHLGSRFMRRKVVA